MIALKFFIPALIFLDAVNGWAMPPPENYEDGGSEIVNFSDNENLYENSEKKRAEDPAEAEMWQNLPPEVFNLKRNPFRPIYKTGAAYSKRNPFRPVYKTGAVYGKRNPFRPMYKTGYQYEMDKRKFHPLYKSGSIVY